MLSIGPSRNKRAAEDSTSIRQSKKKKKAYNVCDFANSKQLQNFDEDHCPLFALSNELEVMGIVVLKVDEDTRASDLAMFNEYLAEIPEFKRGYPLEGDIGAGSFGAINLSSGYHNPSARQCCRTIYETCMPVLAALGSRHGFSNLEAMPDRQMVRHKAPPTESLHRDQSSGLEPSDFCFGTIYNLNEIGIDQHFSCLPMTHALHSAGDKGFTSIKDKEQIKEFNKRRVSVCIPSGHIAIFFENMKHEVTGKKPSTALKRQFLGFRLTDSDEQWWPDNIPKFETQAAFAHKGGEVAPMYPRLWWTNWGNKFAPFVERFIPEMLTKRTYRSGQKAGTVMEVPKIVPPSLEELSNKYPPWSAKDRAMFTPQPLYDF